MPSILTIAEATKSLLAYLNSDGFGPKLNAFKAFPIIEETDIEVTFMVAILWPTMMDTIPMDRHIVKVDRRSGSVLYSGQVSITQDEIQAMFTEAGIGQLDAPATRSADGMFSISYKVLCGTKPYIVHVRSHGNIGTMYAIHHLIKQKCPEAIPVPELFKTTVIPSCKLPVQISAFVPGVMANAAWAEFSTAEKVRLVKRIAHVYDAVWSLSPPTLSPSPKIGEALLDPDTQVLSVGPDRRFQTGGPFSSVSSYLEAWIRQRVLMLQKEEGISQFKTKYLDRILKFASTMPSAIPDCVNQVPVVLTHAAMGLSNMILDSESHDLKAVVNWEVVYCLPLPFCVAQIIDPMFLQSSEDEAQVEELRTAFWDEIPIWRDLLSQEPCQTFLDFYNFGRFLKAEPLLVLDDIEEKWQSWDRNCTVVDAFLEKYGAST